MMKEILKEKSFPARPWEKICPKNFDQAQNKKLMLKFFEQIITLNKSNFIICSSLI